MTADPALDRLHRVDAGALLLLLIVECEGAPPEALDVPGMTHSHALLARLVAGVPERTLWRAIGQAAGDDATVTIGDEVVIGQWMRRTARLVIATGLTVAAPLPPATAGEPGLHLDDDVAALDLPLLALAAEVATTQPGGRLTVQAAALPVAWGVYRRTDLGGEIALDVDRIDDRPHLEHVWLHELAHAMDVLYGHAEDDHLERWAEALADRLNAHRPTTLAEAEPLIVAADEVTDRIHRQPRESWEPMVDLLAWAALDFTNLAEALGRDPELLRSPLLPRPSTEVA